MCGPSVAAIRGGLPRPASRAPLHRGRAFSFCLRIRATDGRWRRGLQSDPPAPLQITRDSKKGQYVRGCGKRKRFHVLYFQTRETGWVPATKLKDFRQNLAVPRPNPVVRVCSRCLPGPHRAHANDCLHGHVPPVCAALTLYMYLYLHKGAHAAHSPPLAQSLRSQKTNCNSGLGEDLRQAMHLCMLNTEPQVRPA